MMHSYYELIISCITLLAS